MNTVVWILILLVAHSGVQSIDHEDVNPIEETEWLKLNEMTKNNAVDLGIDSSETEENELQLTPDKDILIGRAAEENSNEPMATNIDNQIGDHSLDTGINRPLSTPLWVQSLLGNSPSELGNYFSECRRILKQIRGHIQSPSYPESYPLSTNCMWLINVPQGKTVQIEADDFSIGSFMYFTDKLEMWTVGREKITYLGKRDAYTQFDRMASNESVLIKFNHIKNFPTGQFSLRFRTVGSGNNAFRNGTDEPQVESQCGEYFKRSSGIISHTNYGKFKGTARTCLWIIEAGVREQVTLNFLEFGLNDYPFDYVELWTIEGDRFKLIDIYHEGNRPQFPPKLKRSVLIYFQTDEIGAVPRLKIKFNKERVRNEENAT